MGTGLVDQLMESSEFREVYSDVTAVQDAQELLAAEMNRSGITRAELARRLGVSPAAVSNFFRCENPGLITLRRYARALGLTLTVRFEGTLTL